MRWVDQKDNRYTLGLNKYIVGHKLKIQNGFHLQRSRGE